jgi:hypothetical protein
MRSSRPERTFSRRPDHQACFAPLNPDQPESRVKPSKIEGVACDDRIACRLRTHYDVGVGDVRCARPREQRADSLSLRSVQRDYLGFVELDHPPKAYLPGRVPNDLREGSGRNDNPIPVLQRRIEDGEYPAVISFQRNQPSSVENDSVHAAFRGLAPRLRAESIFLAHARSLGLSGPPVSLSASSTIARNSAAFSRDFWTAC